MGREASMGIDHPSYPPRITLLDFAVFEVLLLLFIKKETVQFG